MISSKLSFRDFEDTKDVTAGNTSQTVVVFFGPVIYAEEFEFSFKIHQLADLILGVMRPDHKENADLGEGGYGWGWNSLGIGGGYFNNMWGRYSAKFWSGGNHSRIDKWLRPYKKGDIVRFVVNKKEKTIHVNKNDEDQYLLFKNIDFPEKLCIGCSFWYQSKIELISYREGGGLPPEFDFKEEVTNDEAEENERISSIVENFGNLKIPLANKELSLWKCFLVDSSIRNLHKVNEYKGLNDLKLNVDEKVILMFMLKKKVDISSDNLLDYFLLFKRLGLRREMKQILDRVSQIDSFEEGYQCFKRLCKEQHENDILQSWFRAENRRLLSEISDDSFDTSFGLALFNVLKNKENELRSKPDLNILDLFIGIVVRHIGIYKKIIDPLDHPDFHNVNLDELTLQKVFDKLNGHPTLSNLQLVSTEGKVFPCNRELLVYRFSYFERMFSFDGVEREALLNNKPVKIEDMNNSVLSTFLNYIYTEEIDSEDIVVVINLIVNAFKYLSPKLKEDSLEKLITLTDERLESINVLDRVLQRVCHLLYNNDEVTKYVVPLLGRWSNQTEEVIQKKIQDSCEKEVVERRMRRIDDLEKENEERKRENEEMKKEISLMKEQIKKLLEERQ